MNIISDSDLPWAATGNTPGNTREYASRSANIEVAVATQDAPDRAVGNKDGVEQGEDDFKLFGDDGFTFLDFLDIINPLQHIPLIGTLYREITDDTLDPGSRVIGGSLFLGPLGTLASIANVMVDDATGKDVGEHFLAFFEEDQLEFADSDIPSGASDSVTDVGARSFSPPPEYITEQPARTAQAVAPARKPLSGVEMAMLDSSGPLDPVTAWAMSETIYQNSAVGSPATRPKINIIEGNPNTEPGNWQAVPSRERAAQAPALAPIQAQNAATAAATLEAANTIKDARARNAYYAATSYGLVKPTPDRASRDNEAANPPGSPGAIATEGGWFTDAMLTALGRYNDSASLAAREKPAVVDLNR